MTGDKNYYEKSKHWINGILPRFDENGILFGEQGSGNPKLLDDGSRTIDMGYNLEESLPSLLHYAALTGE